MNNVDEKCTEDLNILECMVFPARSGYVYSMFWKIYFFSPSPKILVSATVIEHYFFIVQLFSSNKKVK